MATYPRAGASEVPAQPDFPELEQRALAYWNAHDTFKTSIKNRDDNSEFVFYDGPPFANGLPHYGHLLTGYVKDIVPRYKTMRGEKVDRRFGWDCHGLPAEVEAERLLGISGKADILKMGIETFNEACRDSVLRYTRDWEEYVTRQARWVDFENDYKTLDLPYMESVMWAFKQLHDKGLIYQGFKVLPYCWRCETPLSNHELRMDDDVYTDRTDPSVTVRFKLETGEWILAWTTTPWTLPSNLAVAVGPDITYVTVEAEDGERYILAEDRLPAYEKELAEREEAALVPRPGTARPPLPAAVRLPHRHGHVRHGKRLAGHPERRGDHRGRHRRGAHGARLRRGRRRGLPGGRHPDRAHGRRAGQVPADGQGLGGPARLRGEQADHQAPAGRRQPRAGWPTTRTPTRTAGGAATRSSTRRCPAGSSR